ncbi:hypothetical protein E4U53_001750 [Claviceps sorghi]|nr:hypothetical protein E4U53_001750 [Claviceps sorghi]
MILEHSNKMQQRDPDARKYLEMRVDLSLAPVHTRKRWSAYSPDDEDQNIVLLWGRRIVRRETRRFSHKTPITTQDKPQLSRHHQGSLSAETQWVMATGSSCLQVSNNDVCVSSSHDDLRRTITRVLAASLINSEDQYGKARLAPMIPCLASSVANVSVCRPWLGQNAVVGRYLPIPEEVNLAFQCEANRGITIKWLMRQVASKGFPYPPRIVIRGTDNDNESLFHGSDASTIADSDSLFKGALPLYQGDVSAQDAKARRIVKQELCIRLMASIFVTVLVSVTVAAAVTKMFDGETKPSPSSNQTLDLSSTNNTHT